VSRFADAAHQDLSSGGSQQGQGGGQWLFDAREQSIQTLYFALQDASACPNASAIPLCHGIDSRNFLPQKSRAMLDEKIFA
jgi:hypothetical protein